MPAVFPVWAMTMTVLGLLTLLVVMGLPTLSFLRERTVVCPRCFAIEPEEGYNYYQCRECGHAWGKDTS